MKINKSILFDIIKIVAIILLASALAYAFESYNFSAENILLVYVVANIIIVLETRNLVYGIISGVLCAIVYEFFFISPKYSFVMADLSYLLSIALFVAICVVISLMSFRLQSQIKKSKKSEQLVVSTYENSKKLLKAKSPEDIANYEVEILTEILKKPVCICLKKRKNFIIFGDEFFDLQKNIEIFNYSLTYDLVCGYKGKKYSELKYTIYPLKSAKSNLGVLVVDCSKGGIRKNEREYLKTNISHVIMALEREKIQDQKEDAKEKIENEELKNILVMNVSNDIREPIGVINDKCRLLLGEYDALSDETVLSSIKQIDDENNRLQDYVDYIFNISKLNSGEEIKKEKTVALKTLLTGAVKLFKGNEKDRISLGECIDVKVNVDVNLIEDVFENIISNSFIHTKSGSKLYINTSIEDGDAVVTFEDDGGGVDEDKLDTIFETAKEDNELQGYKMGLSFCKKIIEAHNGKIKAFNNERGGLTIKILLKCNKKHFNFQVKYLLI